MRSETTLAFLIVSKDLLRSKKLGPTIQTQSTLCLTSSTNVIATSSVDLFFPKTKLKIRNQLIFFEVSGKLFMNFFYHYFRHNRSYGNREVIFNFIDRARFVDRIDFCDFPWWRKYSSIYRPVYYVAWRGGDFFSCVF